MKTTRREFLKDGASLTVGGLAITSGAASAFAQADTDTKPLPTPPSVRKGDMLYRTLGRTGEQVSLVGLGGFHIGVQREEQESIRLIRTAIDSGINFLDNCWDYNGGTSEIRMGKALQGGYRDKVFLMTKIDGRTKEAATSQLNESLQRLQTDHLDLIQFHEILRMEDPDRVFAEGGALEAILAAKKAGKVRHIGFTGHKDPSVHLRMLEVAKKHKFRFDTVQMPLNVMDAHFRSFGHQVLPVLVKEKIGALGMKTFGGYRIIDFLRRNDSIKPIDCLHYSMTLPTSVVITGIDRQEILDQALEAVKTFTPMKQEEVAALLSHTSAAAADGAYEHFKTTTQFDGTVHNPQWMG